MGWRSGSRAVPWFAFVCVLAVPACDAFLGDEEPTPDPTPTADAAPATTSDAGAGALDAATTADADVTPTDVVIDESFATSCSQLIALHGLQVTWKDGACELCRFGSDGPQFAYVDAPQPDGAAFYNGVFTLAAATTNPTEATPGLRISDGKGGALAGYSVPKALTSPAFEDVSLRFRAPPDGGRLEATVELRATSACVRVSKIRVTYGK